MRPYHCHLRRHVATQTADARCRSKRHNTREPDDPLLYMWAVRRWDELKAGHCKQTFAEFCPLKQQLGADTEVILRCVPLLSHPTCLRGTYGEATHMAANTSARKCRLHHCLRSDSDMERRETCGLRTFLILAGSSGRKGAAPTSSFFRRTMPASPRAQ